MNLPAARFAVRLTPRSGIDRVEVPIEGVLRIRVAAPAVEGAANAALIRVRRPNHGAAGPRTDARATRPLLRPRMSERAALEKTKFTCPKKARSKRARSRFAAASISSRAKGWQRIAPCP